MLNSALLMLVMYRKAWWSSHGLFPNMYLDFTISKNIDLIAEDPFSIQIILKV